MVNKEQFSEWYSYVIKEADLVDLRYGVKGFLVIKPWAFKAIKNIYAFYEDALEKRGHLPIHFPVVIPESYFSKEKEHIKGFEGEVFWITKAGFNELEEKLVLRPTSETAFYPMYALWIKGWRDLPLKLYQSGAVWRYETKATRPFLRVREILWIETHNAFSSHEEALRQVHEDIEVAKEVIFYKLKIPYLVLRRPQWDKFAGALDTYALDTIMPDGRALQIATTHDLGQNFSKAFGITFMDKDEEEKFVWQTCYGPGISRMFASIVSIHGDDRGLIYPFSISPIKVVIVPIFGKENEKVISFSNKVCKMLRDKGISCHIDLSDERPGAKFYCWELKGVPFRIEIGLKEVEKGEVTVKDRLGGRVSINVDQISEKIAEMAESFDEKLVERAKKMFDERLFYTEEWDEMRKKLSYGFVKVPFCSIDVDGESCYKRIKEELKAEVRGEEVEGKKPEGKNCIVCGRKANHFVWVARQY